MGIAIGGSADETGLSQLLYNTAITAWHATRLHQALGGAIPTITINVTAEGVTVMFIFTPGELISVLGGIGTGVVHSLASIFNFAVRSIAGMGHNAIQPIGDLGRGTSGGAFGLGFI